MQTGTLIGLGALLLGGAYVLGRRKKAATPPSGGDGDPCAALDGDAKTACEAARAAAGLVGDVFTAIDKIQTHKHDENVTLNGPVVESVPDDFRKVFPCWANAQGDCGYNSAGTSLAVENAPADSMDLRYQNGCTPFPGSPGWSKCAPGTNDMTNDGAPNRADLSKLGTGQPGDLMTFVWTQAHQQALAGRADFFGKPAPAFPLNCPAGTTRAFVRGKAVCLKPCAGGTTPIGHIDLQNGCIGAAGGDFFANAGPSTAKSQTSGGTSGGSGGMKFIPYPTPGHWEHV